MEEIIKTAYKLLWRNPKDGKYYPPMVQNFGGTDTPIGIWLTAHCCEPFDFNEVNTKYAHVDPRWRRYHVQSGGKGTRSKSKGRLAFRPGWHLCDRMEAKQFINRKGEWDPNLVWAKVEYVATRCYQAECDERMWYDGKGKKFKRPCHAYGGLNHLPRHGYYRYRTNPDPTSVEWIICDRIRIVEVKTHPIPPVEGGGRQAQC